LHIWHSCDAFYVALSTGVLMKYRGKSLRLSDIVLTLSKLQVDKLEGDADKMSDHDEMTISQFLIMWDLLDIIATRDPATGLMFAQYFDAASQEFDTGETLQ
jgi:hypothetical protein